MPWSTAGTGISPRNGSTTMQVSGKPHEGWMTLVPVTVFVLVIVAVMGGPTATAHTVSLWISDILDYVSRWLKYL